MINLLLLIQYLLTIVPFYHPHITRVLVLPHVFSRLEPGTKTVYLKKYKNIKKYGSASVKAMISSKLKAYGSKSLFVITLGLILQSVSLPFDVFTSGSKFRKFARATTEIGAKISKGEMGIVNWVWIGAALILFGEPFPKTDDSDF